VVPPVTLGLAVSCFDSGLTEASALAAAVISHKKNTASKIHEQGVVFENMPFLS